jgi:AbrB family looped-hinge helix DNA binding protein
MAGYSTTKLSSRGQVVIPEEIRESLHLKEGDQFVVMGKGDTVILRSIKPPSMDEFEEILAEARRVPTHPSLTYPYITLEFNSSVL